jgi:hypothetical protein
MICNLSLSLGGHLEYETKMFIYNCLYNLFLDRFFVRNIYILYRGFLHAIK